MKKEAAGIDVVTANPVQRGIYIDKRIVIISIIMFFMGRAWLPGGILPFGTAAFAAVITSPECRLKREYSLLYGAMVLLGAITLFQWWQVLLSLLVMLMFYSILKIQSANNRNINGMVSAEMMQSIKEGAILFVCNLGASVIVIAASSARISDAFALVLQSLICFASFFIFRNVSAVFSDDIGRKVMSNEEMACIAIAASVCIMGLPDLVFLQVSLKRIICVLVIMVFSFRGGLGTGAACGVTAGILITASKVAVGSEISAAIIAVYGFSGFLAGLLNKYKKFGVGIGFVIGNLLLAILFSGDKEIIINIYEVGFAVTAFAVLPEKFTEFLKIPQLSGVKIPTVKVNYAAKLRNTAVGKLNDFSGILHEMSNVCRDFTENTTINGNDDLMQIVERMTDKVCKKCMLCSNCWETNFYRSYQSFGVILSVLECRGRILEKDIPSCIADVCPNMDDILTEIKNGFEVWRVDCLWRRRMEETKKLLPMQLNSMSEILANLAKEVDLSVLFEEKIEREIMQKMAEYDMKIKNVTVSKNIYGRLEISADIRCCGMKKACIKSYLPILSKIVGKTLVVDNEATANVCGFIPPTESTSCHCNNKTPWCSFVFTEAEMYKVTVAAAGCCAAGSRISGDSHSFIPLHHGAYMMAISDGMGSGEKAAAQSKAVIKLLELFMESGLSSTAAVSMINSLLETGSDKIASATVDMCVLDLYDGKASFLKLGAVPSVVKHGEHVESIVVPTLPMGMSDEISNVFDCKIIKRTVEDGDIIILISDGITEAFRENGANRVDYYACVENMNTNNPKQIADSLLQLALTNCGGRSRDDMTVVAARVWKN